MKNRFYISDLHFGDERITRFRCGPGGADPDGWPSKEHDAFLTESILDKVGSNDYLYVLGDVCLDMKGFRYLKKISDAVKKIYIVPGNHDFIRKKGPRIEDYQTLKNVVILPGIVQHGDFWLSHCPIHPNELRGRKNIHGHVHLANVQDSRYINVSVDNLDYRPVSLMEIDRD